MSALAERLEAFNEKLIPSMVQLKYKHMAESAFRFLRGTCHLFYEDLSKIEDFPSSPNTWISGDLHLENFGSFKGNNRMVYFDLNDFDEAMLAPAAWELARVLTSIFVAFDTLKIDKAEAMKTAKLFLSTYSEILAYGKAYYIDPRTAEGIVRSFLKSIKKRKESDLIKKIADEKGDQFKIKIDNRTHFALDPKLRAELISHLTEWLKSKNGWAGDYTVKDAAFRVAGTGSIGLKRYMFLLQSNKNKKKYLLVEMKEAAPSSLAPYNTIKQPIWASQAERVVTLKHRMQNISPALLSPNVFNGDIYVLQEMQPLADKISFESIATKNDCLELVIKDMALLTASAQIRSGGIQHSAIIDELMAFGKQTTWQQPLLDYAIKYSKQVTKDYNQFMADYKTIAATAGIEETN
jgi:uncharacterized protein (DUF2252 family)